MVQAFIGDVYRKLILETCYFLLQFTGMKFCKDF
jgi:hypothetical protein